MTDFLFEIMGWTATALVLFGFWANSKNYRMTSFIVWIIGDVLWVVYDFYILNWSHATLSFVIIGLNLFGIYNTQKIEHANKTIPETSK